MGKIGDFLFGKWGDIGGTRKPKIFSDNRHYRDKMLVKKVIEMVKENPDNFSSIWWGSRDVSRFMSSKNNKVKIWDDGSIHTPFKAKMLDSEKKELKKLITPLYERDMDKLLEKL